MDFKKTVLIVVLVFFIAFFAVSLFKNIAYPLLWNDEAETAMYAKRILQYGYPKIYDGKNVVYPMPYPKDIGADPKTGAYTATPWLQFYFCAIGLFFADMAGDIYVKTAILRIPFAITGLAGLVILALSVASVFDKNNGKRLLFLILFFIIETLSVSFILHLREARYYPLLFFLTAAFFYCLIRFKITGLMTRPVYISSASFLLILIFNTFTPVYFIFLAALIMYELLDLLKRRDIKDFALNLSPVLISIIALIPFSIFYKLFPVSLECGKIWSVSEVRYGMHDSIFIKYFLRHEFLGMAILIKLIMALFLFFSKSSIGKDASPDGRDAAWHSKLKLSCYFSIFFLVYYLIIIRSPLPYLFLRYFIILQPVMAAILLLDIFITYELLSGIKPFSPYRNEARKIYSAAAIILFLTGVFRMDKIEYLGKHLYEISHQYKGPLDFAIPYIMRHYKAPESLVIATNYEECSYMYYLGSKVVWGSNMNNPAEDLKTDPDIIIYRKMWRLLGLGKEDHIFDAFLKKGNFKKIGFPVYDYLVNNSPQPGAHLYGIPVAEKEDERLDIYTRDEG